MDLTQGTKEEKNNRAKKMMLWFGIVSLIMAFAGWTSAYVVSSKRKDWLSEIALPDAFYVSTGIILISSLTYWLAKSWIKKEKTKSKVSLMLVLTLALGISFIALQFVGFSQMISNGYYFTGPTSNIKMSYIFLIAFVHILHVLAGLISLLVVIFNHFRGLYTAKNHLGLTLGAIFWHFLDLLWIYLLIFMLIVK